MNLCKIVIENFRSIEKFRLDFTSPSHRILVGKNECGKSNILKAIASCDNAYEAIPSDLREQCDSGFARCVFSLDASEVDELTAHFIEKKVFKYTESPILGYKSITQLLKSDRITKSFAYRNNIDGNGSFLEFNKNDHHEPINDLKIVQNIPDSTEPLKKYQKFSFVHSPSLTNDERQLLNPYLSNTSTSDIENRFISEIQNYLELPQITYWQYSDKFNLPYSVPINEFITSPKEISRPLLNIFILHGISTTDLKDKFTHFSKNENKLNNWLAAISKSANTFLSEKWSEFSASNPARILIDSINDCTKLRIRIADDINTYSFEQRSDGFRRLITFLLLIGAESKKSYLNNGIILIDEPELCLHPSSARDLRDSLFEIGKNNYIIYATHSISMIDSKNIRNNLIVTKHNECTDVEHATESSGYIAKSIYAALGQSVYENVKEISIVVEGYTDSSLVKHLIEKENLTDSIGVTFSNGAKCIPNIISFLELGNRHYLILTDFDKYALNCKSNFEREGPAGHWYTYKDVSSKTKCLEDFYQKDFLKKILEEIPFSNTQCRQIILDSIPDDNRIEWLKKKLKENNHSEDEINIILMRAKQTATTRCKQQDYSTDNCVNKELIDALIYFIKNKLAESSS